MAKTNLTFTSSQLLVSLLSLSAIFLISAVTTAEGSEEATVHIVYTENPRGDDSQAFNIQTLTSIFGSEQAAREALIYSYKNSVSGFSAKLTSDQVAQLLKQPGVMHVAPSRSLRLHSGPGSLNRR